MFISINDKWYLFFMYRSDVISFLKSFKEKYGVIRKNGTQIQGGHSQRYSLMAEVSETLRLSNAVSLVLRHSPAQIPSVGSLFSLAFKAGHYLCSLTSTI